MAIPDVERRAAEKQMRDDLHGVPRAVRARYDRRSSRVVVRLDSGLELAFPPRLAQGLEKATPEELTNIEISPLGTGLHWPDLDADLYVPGLLAGTFRSERWMAAQAASNRRNEQSTSETAPAPSNSPRIRRSRKAATAP